MEFISTTTQMGPDLNLQPKVKWPRSGSLSPGGAKGWPVGAKNGEHKGARRCDAYMRKSPQARVLHNAIERTDLESPKCGSKLHSSSMKRVR